MDIQLILTIMLGIAAAVYVIRKVVRQFSHVEKDPKCDNCPAVDPKRSKK